MKELKKKMKRTDESILAMNGGADEFALRDEVS